MSDDHNSHDVLVAKYAAIVSMFCVTTVFGGVPFILNHYFKWTEKNANARSAKVVTYLLHFGGGVLLATIFVHLLPEVQEVAEHLKASGQVPKVSFALAETLMCAGFMLMYLIEESLHRYLHRNKKAVLHKDDGVGAAFERGHSVRRSALVKRNMIEEDQEDNSEEGNEENIRDSKRTLTTVAPSNGNTYQNGKTDLDVEIQIIPTAEPTKCKSELYTSKLEHSLEKPCIHSLDHPHSFPHKHTHDHGGHGHSHLPINTTDGGDVISSSIRGLGIVLALSLHEVFEGLAIGLEKNTSSVWFLFAAVLAHKLVLAFCVGVELLVARTRPVLAVVYTVTFAIVSPIGIAIGIAVSHSSAASGDGLPSMILQGIACGTLLYVVFFEILSKRHAGFGAFIGMLIGFCVMFGLQTIGGGHSHHHAHAHLDHDHHDHDHLDHDHFDHDHIDNDQFDDDMAVTIISTISPGVLTSLIAENSH